MGSPSDEMDELGADGWRDRMLFVSTEIMKAPRDRPLTEAEHVEMGRACLALAEMFVVMDQKLCEGYMPPRSWQKDLARLHELPSSDMHRNLRAESEVIVQKMLQRIEKRVHGKDPQAAQFLMEQLGKLLSTLALFTSESVRLACINNVQPVQQAEDKPRLHLVHDAGPKEEN